ncbi:amidohydrolase family protein [Thalassotalea ponticola]|uniref:Xaa-Pro dipeptidase n=1 Tax=Thalassotalea ponticola TaxID=1523392 RepID=UPI0025B2EF6E|nr:amidohydrolase family protein [Thalassotalea ponticola]MDN3652266.1 amidohydrolase family protein [Thalassotalea ponticola]
MKTLIKATILAAVTSASSMSAWAAEQVIKAGFVLDVTNGDIKKDQYILIRDNKILSISKNNPAPSAEQIDLQHKYVLPGLMDMHTHVVRHLSKQFHDRYFQSPHRATIGGVVNAEKTLMAGFTTIRNVGAADYMDVALRNAINANEIPGPRMAVSGPSLGITGGHCDRNSLNHRFEERGDGVSDGPWQVRQQVRKNVKYQVDVIKFCATGGVFSKGTKVGQRQYTLEEMQAIVDEAHTHGRTVAAHAHGTEGIEFAIKAGVDSIEHASYLTPQTIALAKEYGTYLSMDIYNTEYTLSEGVKNGVPQENIDKEKQVGTRQRESFRNAVTAGAKIVLGTDAGIYPHGDNAKQLSRMTQFGMTELQAIQAATINSAALLKWSDKLGQVKAGMLADLIAVDRNPLEDITSLENVSFVMKDGIIYKQ